MKHIMAFLSGLLMLSVSAIAQSKSDPVQIVGTAEIVKIDAKKKSLQVRELMEPVVTGGGGRGSARTEGRRGGGGGGRGGGGRRGGGGVGFPGGGGVGFPGGGRPGGSGGTATSKAKEYKIFVGKDTIMKLANTDIGFTDLHIGDRITVSGTPKGSKGDIDAATITRDFQ
jgi:hypothetical protein